MSAFRDAHKVMRRERQARRFAAELWQRDNAALILSTEEYDYVLRVERPDGRIEEYRWVRRERDVAAMGTDSESRVEPLESGPKEAS